MKRMHDDRHVADVANKVYAKYATRAFHLSSLLSGMYLAALGVPRVFSLTAPNYIPTWSLVLLHAVLLADLVRGCAKLIGHTRRKHAGMVARRGMSGKERAESELDEIMDEKARMKRSTTAAWFNVGLLSFYLIYVAIGVAHQKDAVQAIMTVAMLVAMWLWFEKLAYQANTRFYNAALFDDHRPPRSSPEI